LAVAIFVGGNVIAGLWAFLARRRFAPLLEKAAWDTILAREWGQDPPPDESTWSEVWPRIVTAVVPVLLLLAAALLLQESEGGDKVQLAGFSLLGLSVGMRAWRLINRQVR